MNYNPFDHVLQELNEVKQLLQNRSLSVVTDEQPYLSLDKAADFISSTPGALRQMVYKGQIQHIKKQGKLYFRRKDLIAWFESGSVDAVEITGEDLLLTDNKKRAS